MTGPPAPAQESPEVLLGGCHAACPSPNTCTSPVPHLISQGSVHTMNSSSRSACSLVPVSSVPRHPHHPDLSFRQSVLHLECSIKVHHMHTCARARLFLLTCLSSCPLYFSRCPLIVRPLKDRPGLVRIRERTWCGSPGCTPRTNWSPSGWPPGLLGFGPAGVS